MNVFVEKNLFDEKRVGEFIVEKEFDPSRKLKDSYLGRADPEQFKQLFKLVLQSKKGENELNIIQLNEKIEKIEKRLDYFENNTICIDGYREISIADAEIEIETFLRELRSEGAPDFTVIDIIKGLNLPPDQIDQVLDNMRRR